MRSRHVNKGYGLSFLRTPGARPTVPRRSLANRHSLRFAVRAAFYGLAGLECPDNERYFYLFHRCLSDNDLYFTFYCEHFVAHAEADSSVVFWSGLCFWAGATLFFGYIWA